MADRRGRKGKVSKNVGEDDEDFPPAECPEEDETVKDTKGNKRAKTAETPKSAAKKVSNKTQAKAGKSEQSSDEPNNKAATQSHTNDNDNDEDNDDDEGQGIKMFASIPKAKSAGTPASGHGSGTKAATVDAGGGAHKKTTSTEDASTRPAHASREQATSGSSKSSEKSKEGHGLLVREAEERSFEMLGLEPWLVKSCHSMGLKRPTDVQWNCIPPALKGRNIMGSAQTGSGKTAAFALPILQMLSRDPFGVYAVVLTPTRELAFQIRDQFAALGAPMQLREFVVVGGLDMMQQAQQLCRRPHVVIATPGRLADHVKSSVGVADVLKRTRFLVMDEADRLLEPCFEPDLAAILDALPAQRVTMLFSATITASISELQHMALSDCFQFQADDPKTTVTTVTEQYCHMPITVKDCYLIHLLRESKSPALIIFTGTRKTCQYLTLLLEVRFVFMCV
jgi:ATP-dependent RNA helicase DDX49/DBP8